ncbi:hypothetical protein EBH_0025100 [Eimeria brunetti]|uniref:Uncharacterized protein n=1 Tax=Eimeria brunetti TaxID=51314 RepID=U6LJ63_9EIME|nr:hypothetical protein EBH_0025100 [Eimeria brunetti]
MQFTRKVFGGESLGADELACLFVDSLLMEVMVAISGGGVNPMASVLNAVSVSYNWRTCVVQRGATEMDDEKTLPRDF